MRMNFCLLLLGLLSVPSFGLKPHKVTEAGKKKGFNYSWVGSDSCDSPESVYFDKVTGFVFVSNIGGKNGAEKDGNGFIQKYARDGKIIDAGWVKGLDAPKGMRVRKGILWVSDIDRVIGINVRSGIVNSITPVPGAKFLNDVALGGDGSVYVSDTLGSRIYKIAEGKVSVFIEGRDWASPNGLLVDGETLYVAAWGYTTDWKTKKSGQIYAINLISKKKTMITKKPLGNLDGLEWDHKGNFLVSDWVAGKVFRVSPKGKAELILQGFKGAADIGFVGATSTIIIPAMGENKVYAFNLAEFPGY